MVLRSHWRNHGEHKRSAVLNSELSKLSPLIFIGYTSKFYQRNFLQNLINISIMTYRFLVDIGTDKRIRKLVWSKQ